METNGASVASATLLGQKPECMARRQRYRRLQFLADFDTLSSFGCAIDSYLTETGMQPAYVSCRRHNGGDRYALAPPTPRKSALFALQIPVLPALETHNAKRGLRRLRQVFRRSRLGLA